MIKKTWGESLIRVIGLGIVQFLVSAVVVILSIAPTYMLASAFNTTGLLIGITVGALLLLLSGLIFMVANTIFNIALYVYANKNMVASGFDEDLVRGAFKQK